MIAERPGDQPAAAPTFSRTDAGMSDADLIDAGSSAAARAAMRSLDGALSAAVEIFTADGQEAPGDSSFTVDLAPFDMAQISDVLARLPEGERAGLVIRVAITSAEGAILAYLSEVDNTTNDASYQEGFRFSF